MLTSLLASVVVAWGLTIGGSGQAADDRAEITAVVQKLFDAIAARDAEMAKQAVLADAQFVSARTQDGKVVTRRTTLQQFVENLAKGTNRQLERMWNPEVRVQGTIATLWAPYDFYRDGTFSHCGIDAFDLVKTPDGWRIAGGVWSVETTGCPASPLGPVK
jgi:putative lumazine-binding protein